MEHRIRIGKRLPLLALLLYTCFVPAYAQSSLLCAPTAVPPLVRAEGLAERMGDIVLDCSGGTPGATLTVNLTVLLTVNVTNKLAADNSTDVRLTVDTGSGPMPAVLAQPAGRRALRTLVCSAAVIA